MPPTVNVLRGDDAVEFVTNTIRPAAFNRQGFPVDQRGGLMVNARQIAANAFLRREEWERLDATVTAMVKLKLNAWADIIGAGLTVNSSLATIYTKWSMASERVAADARMSLGTRRTKDRQDLKDYSVPLPIVACEYEIDAREMLAARALGRDISAAEAEEAAGAVGEKLEDILINGETTLSIPGYRTLTARDTNTAAGYGGGDFGTLSNIRPTFLGMLSALSAKRYNGPFFGYVAPTQYHEMLARYSDGSGQTGLETVEELPQIRKVEQNDLVPDTNVVLVQATRNVVEIEIGLSLENRRWENPDGSAMHFVVLAAAVPKLKTDYEGNAGIAHATGA